jgi:hypothetical protein
MNVFRLRFTYSTCRVGSSFVEVFRLIVLVGGEAYEVQLVSAHSPYFWGFLFYFK